ncbi:MAG: hypothetical protein L0154_23470, partial [Chloroflexi bacterium]|nr:hypothetical protein [Chloroflexota bacterium]
WWYPTPAWAAGVPFEDTRTLDIPAGLSPGEYQLRVGWYRQEETGFIRMEVAQGTSKDDLFVLPENLTIADGFLSLQNRLNFMLQGFICP